MTLTGTLDNGPESPESPVIGHGPGFAPEKVQSSGIRQTLSPSPCSAPTSAIRAVGTGVTPNPGGNRATVRAVGSDVVHRDVYVERVDVSWFDAMGVEHPVVEEMTAAGRTGPPRYLVNRAAADRFGFETSTGEEVIIGANGDDQTPVAVSGILPNMHLRPMRQEIKPTIFRVMPVRRYIFGALVRFAPGRVDDGMQHLQEVWAEMRPDTPLQALFLDDEVAELYEQERRFTTFSAVLAGLAILMAALGLASLVAYLTRLRTKEIGVRKALGGSVGSIVALLNKEYVWIVGAAFALGAPLAWVAADWWLGQFAYRIGLSVWPFLAAGLGALVVAVAAVSAQALRAARVDPAQVLRSE